MLAGEGDEGGDADGAVEVDVEVGFGDAEEEGRGDVGMASVGVGVGGRGCGGCVVVGMTSSILHVVAVGVIVVVIFGVIFVVVVVVVVALGAVVGGRGHVAVRSIGSRCGGGGGRGCHGGQQMIDGDDQGDDVSNLSVYNKIKNM